MISRLKCWRLTLHQRTLQTALLVIILLGLGHALNEAYRLPPLGKQYSKVGSPRHRISTEATFPPHDDKTSDNSEGNKNNGRSRYLQQEPPSTLRLKTTMQGGNSQSGNMFDLTAKQHLRIHSFEIHIADKLTHGLVIYSKQGTHQGFEEEPSAWTQLCNTSVTGRGKGQRVSLGLNIFQSNDNNNAEPAPVPILQGSTQAFYLTLVGANSRLTYTNGDEIGRLYSEDDNLQFFEGVGIIYAYGRLFNARLFNGAIVYALDGDLVPSASPSAVPSVFPSAGPSRLPSVFPSNFPSVLPSNLPSDLPSNLPSIVPSFAPSDLPSAIPTDLPSYIPSDRPSIVPSARPSVSPSDVPSDQPSNTPSLAPSDLPSDRPSMSPSSIPSTLPTASPSYKPSRTPSIEPTTTPTSTPTSRPSFAPTHTPTNTPSVTPSIQPSVTPSVTPTNSLSATPTDPPSFLPSIGPSFRPSDLPSALPSVFPSNAPSVGPTMTPTRMPSNAPSIGPTRIHSTTPSTSPKPSSSSHPPSVVPSLSQYPSIGPTSIPTIPPSNLPSTSPSVYPSALPSTMPSNLPSDSPSQLPIDHPSITPSVTSSVAPTRRPTQFGWTNYPTVIPTTTPTTTPSVTPSITPTATPTATPTTLAPTGVFNIQTVWTTLSIIGTFDRTMNDNEILLFELAMAEYLQTNQQEPGDDDANNVLNVIQDYHVVIVQQSMNNYNYNNDQESSSTASNNNGIRSVRSAGVTTTTITTTATRLEQQQQQQRQTPSTNELFITIRVEGLCPPDVDMYGVVSYILNGEDSDSSDTTTSDVGGANGVTFVEYLLEFAASYSSSSNSGGYDDDYYGDDDDLSANGNGGVSSGNGNGDNGNGNVGSSNTNNNNNNNGGGGGLLIFDQITRIETEIIVVSLPSSSPTSVPSDNGPTSSSPTVYDKPIQIGVLAAATAAAAASSSSAAAAATAGTAASSAASSSAAASAAGGTDASASTSSVVASATGGGANSSNVEARVDENEEAEREARKQMVGRNNKKMTAVQANSGRATGKKVMRKLEKQGQAQVVNNFNAASGSKEQRKKHGMNHCNSQQTDLNSSHHMSHSNQATALSARLSARGGMGTDDTLTEKREGDCEAAEKIAMKQMAGRNTIKSTKCLANNGRKRAKKLKLKFERGRLNLSDEESDERVDGDPEEIAAKRQNYIARLTTNETDHGTRQEILSLLNNRSSQEKESVEDGKSPRMEERGYSICM